MQCNKNISGNLIGDVRQGGNNIARAFVEGTFGTFDNGEKASKFKHLAPIRVRPTRAIETRAIMAAPIIAI